MITPQTQAKKLAKAIGLSAPLYLKREDRHSLGSHKGRSIPLMIKTYLAQGADNFVISSSGNAALAAGLMIKKFNKTRAKKIFLKIFVGRRADKNKLKKLKKISKTDKNISLIQSANPKQQAFLEQKKSNARLLRQSCDDTALTGYHELAKELAKIKNISAVFVPTSSGTTAQGLFEGFKKLLDAGAIKTIPQIHIAQTPDCHPFVNITTNSKNRLAKKIASDSSQPSLANAIVDKVARRQTPIAKVLKNSHGRGWIADNQQLLEAVKLVRQTEKIKISFNSALSLAGLRMALADDDKFFGPVVLLITGE
ncbi:MAG: hypothetical protein COU31_01050 [Candidatus Magasanikbacteria bacterium CG10_big_fil_rev_8_21_14_0_10_40_10]|uniref:Tryptophan synthase beta chain-like PALP domain-containing protein n=1 Tax=Candidatus Magasanikbacteria bacterium CG10_big_fil_rev_8_21_14_0_10_40_10 TaxID=1974648 RepID=A0A2M6W4T4_9BACT|nr:MAG: hypothetical protein COU31_01050 [Candidatus Magasanikbacteria bacterium CG10_big_fil_rev_8_21_14_0_10_40_10]